MSIFPIFILSFLNVLHNIYFAVSSFTLQSKESAYLFSKIRSKVKFLKTAYVLEAFA
jgi:hypothetical protein